MSRTHRIEIIGSFAVAVRQGQFSQPRDAPLAESTVSDTLNHVCVSCPPVTSGSVLITRYQSLDLSTDDVPSIP
jgi:hypothetical protein